MGKWLTVRVEGWFYWWLIRGVTAISPLISLTFLVAGSYQVLLQDARIRHSRPVPVKVISSEVETHYEFHGPTTYSPRIHFSYSVNGVRYFGENCLPADKMGTEGWARAVVERFPPGTTQTGYYRPGVPADAFLVRQYMFWPYTMLLFGGWMGAITITAIVEGLRQRLPRKPVAAAGASFELRPLPSKRRKALWAAIGVCALLIVGLALLAQYFAVAWVQHEWFPPIVAVVHISGALAISVWSVVTVVRLPDILPPRVFVAATEIAQGQSASIRVEQAVDNGKGVDSLAAALLCRVTEVRGGGHLNISTRVFCELASMAINAPQRSGRLVTAAFKFPGAFGPATTTARRYPLYRWFIKVTVRNGAGAQTVSEFPITVQSVTAK